MPGTSYNYEFVAQPAINEKLKNELRTEEQKEAFLIRLATTLGANPRTAGAECSRDSLYRGKRKLDHMDEALGFCIVVFKVVGRTVTIYLVKPMD